MRMPRCGGTFRRRGSVARTRPDLHRTGQRRRLVPPVPRRSQIDTTIPERFAETMHRDARACHVPAADAARRCRRRSREKHGRARFHTPEGCSRAPSFATGGPRRGHCGKLWREIVAGKTRGGEHWVEKSKGGESTRLSPKHVLEIDRGRITGRQPRGSPQGRRFRRRRWRRSR